MEKLIKDLEARKEKARAMGGQEKINKQHNLGRYTARERIDKFLDPDTFLEFGMLASSLTPGMEEKSPADGLICGVGKVDNRPVVVAAVDKTVFAGSDAIVHVKKIVHMHEYAVKRGFPLLLFGEGGGLRVPDGMGSDGISENMMEMSIITHCRRTPLVVGIMGDSYGASTWEAASADFVVQVKGTCMAVGSPRMLEIATSESVTPEDLGGWKIHADHTGQVDAFADNDDHCLEIMKQFLTFMPSNASEEPPHRATDDDPCRRVEEVLKIVTTDLNRAYDMRRLIKVLVDDGIFFELKALYGRALITGLARLNGRVVGIMANQPMFNAGAAGPQECDKAIEFICLCDSFNIPLVFLHDVPGFLIGSYAEKNKMPTKIMVWNQAIAWSTVPKISVVVRKSVGAAYGNMCGPAMGADLVVAWPTAYISFTGDEVGVNVVYGRELATAKKPEAERKKLLKQWSHESAPYRAAAKYLIEDVIDPRDTRKFLCQALEYACLQKGSMSERQLANWPTGF